MENQTFIEDLKQLATQEDLLAVGREVSELKTKFDDFILEEERKLQVAQLEAQEKGETLESDGEIEQFKEAFYEVYADFKQRRKAVVDAKNVEEADNLKKKRALITRFKEVIANEENIGIAFSAHKEINEEWKSIGDIPRDKRHDIQQEYSRLMEEFFYNMKIYREIKDYDFKKNFDAKQDVINRIKALMDVPSVKEVEVSLKAMQNEWEDIGPTKQELWEQIKEDYWNSIKAVYDRIRAHYDSVREQMHENIESKKELIEKTKALIALERDSIKVWNKHTQQLIELQETWKKIGFGPKKENEQLWQDFRALCDSFFEGKSAYFESIQGDFDKVAKRKEEIIEKVEAIKDDANWKQTSEKVLRLQKEWKSAGNAGAKNEQRLWKRFRTACDAFFEKKKVFFEELDKANEANLTAKQALIEKIEGYKPNEDKKQTLADLKQFAEEFSAIGQVPFKQKDVIFKAYKTALDKQYNALGLKGEEKENVLFQAKLSQIAGSADSAELFEREKQTIRTEINKIKQDMIQLENNLGFFANSKGANALKAEVEKKVEAERAKIEALKTKLKSIPNE
jgi:predicted DNA-binding protein YlxM (UPF0122 family)